MVKSVLLLFVSSTLSSETAHVTWLFLFFFRRVFEDVLRVHWLRIYYYIDRVQTSSTVSDFEPFDSTRSIKYLFSDCRSSLFKQNDSNNWMRNGTKFKFIYSAASRGTLRLSVTRVVKLYHALHFIVISRVYI